jgi:streptomycin 6-kinase
VAAPAQSAWDDPAWRARLVRRFGAQVTAWCDEAPALAERLATRWGLEALEPLPWGSTSRAVACRRAGGERAILKLTPDRALARAEAAALRAWEPAGRAPRLWAIDAQAGALLMEAIEPGTRLTRDPDAATAREFAALAAALHVPAPASGFPSLAERVDFVFAITAARLRGTTVPAGAVERSHAAARALAETFDGPPALVHGDLHPANVLRGPPGRELVAIDPRACAGDPGFDLVDWVLAASAAAETWRRRADALAAAVGYPPERLWQWCAALAMLVVPVARDDAAFAAALVGLGP